MKSRNFLASMVDVTGDSTVGVEFSAVHGLEEDSSRKLVPHQFMVVDQLQAGSLYRGVTAWTETVAYFYSDVANPRFTVIFF
jgi:hypothetical protein